MTKTNSTTTGPLASLSKAEKLDARRKALELALESAEKLCDQIRELIHEKDQAPREPQAFDFAGEAPAVTQEMLDQMTVCSQPSPPCPSYGASPLLTNNSSE